MKPMVKWLISLLLIPFMGGVVWAVDARIEQKMGSVVDDQLDRRQIQYLQFQKRNRELTEKEKRDLEYYRDQLNTRKDGGK